MSRRDEMSRLLIAIRGGRKQVDVAALAGLTQLQVSRAERGTSRPLSPDEAGAYADALGATAEQRARLVELAGAKTASHIVTRQVLVRSGPEIQARLERLERAAATVRSWVPDMIPGILQSRAYTQTMLDGDGIVPAPEWWPNRLARLALLDQPTPLWHQLVSEAALRWPLGSGAAAAEQVEHMAVLSRRPNVHLGVLDLDTPKSFTAPRGFHLYDNHTAVVATDIGTAFVDDPGDVAHYAATFDQVAGAALYGDEARALLTRIARSLRRRARA